MSLPPKLSDFPDWIYVLRDAYDFYLRMSAGGSGKIRTHQRSVRERINRVIKADAEMRFAPPEGKPVTGHLNRALANGRVERHGPFIRSLEAIQHTFTWQYGYEKVPRGLERKFAYAELVGPNGPVITNEVILGLVLFAPGCTYPAHANRGISESYICLSGAVSENDQGVYGPGSLIFNPPDTVHRITVADFHPALLLYAWEGTPEDLAEQKMVFTRKSG
ncbi:dimethylsulfonioproprionate lyase family protein [uncultured Tateyamaria sp.]|uniref:dimethylsulfonioproprionate lyase family protein n=1 Tax=uncultured Tateyamaria sp. TaxID=455651 RepID=UPI0026077970|nr:dimethylsulfonioproprionate lyase family protein [uncultured Tateyamaria sp.]